MQKVAILALFLVMGAMAHSIDSPQEMASLWSSWKLQYNKEYSSLQEEAVRFKNFLATYKFIQEWNAGNNTCTLGLNQFSDLTTEEFGALYTGLLPSLEVDEENVVELENIGAPSSWDWRDHGKVTPVQNQGSCGSCWAFATVATLESQYAIQGHSLTRFSEQELVDCVNTCKGCNGGLPSLAYQWTKTHGIETSSNYPYTAKTGTCKYDASKSIKVNSGWSQVPIRNADALFNAIYKVPVAVAVQADQAVFQSYKSGIIGSGCGANLNHAITAVGYSTANGGYAIIKNSWGTSWGQNGYAFISTSSQYNSGLGACGILGNAAYPN